MPCSKSDFLVTQAQHPWTARDFQTLSSTHLLWVLLSKQPTGHCRSIWCLCITLLFRSWEQAVISQGHNSSRKNTLRLARTYNWLKHNEGNFYFLTYISSGFIITYAIHGQGYLPSIPCTKFLKHRKQFQVLNKPPQGTRAVPCPRASSLRHSKALLAKATAVLDVTDQEQSTKKSSAVELLAAQPLRKLGCNLNP